MKRTKLAPSGQLSAVDPRLHVPTRVIAKEMGMNRQTVRRWLDAAGIEYMRKGPRRYYARVDLDAFIASQRAKPGQAS